MKEQNSINELFNNNSKNFANSIEKEFKSGSYARGNVFIQHIRAILGKYPSKIFDYGCGTGRISVMLGMQGYKVFGIDPAAEHIEICNAINDQDHVKFEVMTEDFDFPIKSFDAVVSSSVFEFVPDTQAYIDNIKKMLNPNGVLFISFPNLSSFWRLYARVRFGKKYKHFDFQKNLLSRTEIEMMFKNNGFERVGSPIHYESVLDKKGLGVLNKLVFFGTLSLYTFRLKNID